MPRNDVRVISGGRTYHIPRAEARQFVSAGLAQWRQVDGSEIAADLLRKLGGESRCIELARHDESGRSGSGGRSSCSLSGGIPGRGASRPVIVTLHHKDGSITTEQLERNGRVVEEMALNPLESWALDPAKLAALGEHIAKETASGAFSRV